MRWQCCACQEKLPLGDADGRTEEWTTESMQFLSKSKWHFSQKQQGKKKKKKNNPKSHMQPQKTSNNQSESEQEQSWRYHTS